MQGDTARVDVLLACPGLDHARRGFETFARECFEALHEHPGLAVVLAKGSGARRAGEIVVRTPTRRSRAVRGVATLVSRAPYVIEHLAFAALLAPRLLWRRPAVVYFSEWHVGRVLSRWRRLTRGRYALVFCNGALVSNGYETVDLVQQLVPGAIEFVVAHGGSAERQLFLPLGVATPRSPVVDREARAALRRRLGLPQDRAIVMSAGAINRQKRVDYLVEEIASLPEPRPFLLLLGEQEAESAAILRAAAEQLGRAGHTVRTVSPEEMGSYYDAADAFVLASLWESFGRVLVEAQSHGLPCLAHDHPVMRWVLGDAGQCLDLRTRGQVAGWITGLSSDDASAEHRERRARIARERFSWDVLAPRYVDMLRGAAQARPKA